MICPNCGANIDDNSKFCGECGISLTVNNATAHEKENKNVMETQVSFTNLYRWIELRIRPIGFIIGLIFIVIGIVRIRSEISYSRFSADYLNEVTQYLRKIEVSISMLITAVGVAIDVLALKK